MSEKVGPHLTELQYRRYLAFGYNYVEKVYDSLLHRYRLVRNGVQSGQAPDWALYADAERLFGAVKRQ